MEKELLKVEDLVVEYTSENEIVHAVNGLSFSLERGKTLALVGETGAGKTTTAKTILRVLPDRSAHIRGGKIYFNGIDLLSLSEKEMRKIRGEKISMIFQDPMTALNPVMRIGDQIAEVIQEHNSISKEESRQRATEMLEMVGITPERYDEYPHQFSGGMKQRVIIAIALACQPELLLADEPTTALDVTIQAQVLEMINNLKTSQNTSMILITHDLGVVANMADSVAIVYAGKIVEIGSKRQIFKHPMHPYTIGLFGAIPDLRSDAPRLHNIEGMPPDPTNLPKGCAFNPRCHRVEDACKADLIPFAEVESGHFVRCVNPHERKHWNEKSN